MMPVLARKMYLTALVVILLFHVCHTHKGYKKMRSMSSGGQGSYYQPYYYHEPQEQGCQSSYYPGCSQQYSGCQSSHPCQAMQCGTKQKSWSSPQSMCFENKQIVGEGSCQPSCCYQHVSCPSPCSSPCDNGCDSCGGGCSMGYSSGCGSGCGTGCGTACGTSCTSGYGSGFGTGCGSGCGTGCGSVGGSGSGPSYGSGCGTGCGSSYGSGYGTGCGSGCGPRSTPGCGGAVCKPGCSNGGCNTPRKFVILPMLVPEDSLGPNFMGNCGVDGGCGKCASPCL